MNQEQFEMEERAFIEARNRVSDDVLVARMNSSPDNGGALMVELSNFVVSRVEREPA